jgi:1-acyl-sn-glycerol-3-phosphate acyltransferase
MPNNKFLYSLGRMLILAYTRAMLRMDIEAQCDLPEGAKLFVANHPSATDPFLIHLVSPQHLSVLITQSAFDFPVLGWYMRSTEQIPVAAGKGETALNDARRSIDAGRSIAIFTEGALSPQAGGFHPPRTGAARLALQSRIPVIPVGIYLPRERSHCIKSHLTGKPTEGYWYLRGPYGITLGQPMQFAGDAEDRPLVQAISRSIMERIRVLALASERRVCGLNPPAFQAA